MGYVENAKADLVIIGVSAGSDVWFHILDDCLNDAGFVFGELDLREFMVSNRKPTQKPSGDLVSSSHVHGQARIEGIWHRRCRAGDL